MGPESIHDPLDSIRGMPIQSEGREQMKKRSFFLPMALLSALLWQPTPSCAQIPAKVALVDTQRVLLQSQLGKGTTQQLRDYLAGEQQEVTKREAELMALKSDLDRQKLMLSAARKKEKEEELSAKYTSHMTYSQRTQTRLRDLRKDAINFVREQIQSIADEIKEKDGYSRVLYDSTNSTSADVNRHDITPQVIRLMDERPLEPFRGVASLYTIDFLSAVSTGNTAEMRSLLERGADIEARDKDGATALMIASAYGRMEIVRNLVSFGADTEATEGGATALMIAATAGQMPIVETLVSLGADIDTQEGPGTILMLLSMQGTTESVRALVNLGADTEVKNKSGWTALMIAATAGRLAIVETLVSLGADIATKGKDGNTVLMNVSALGKPESIRTLIGLGADIEATNKAGMTALMVAAAYGNYETLLALEDLGANTNAVDKNGNTALKLARINDQVVCAAHLVLRRELNGDAMRKIE